MKKILVASHGELADGVKSSLSILVGNTNSMSFINAYVTKEDIDESLNTFFQAFLRMMRRSSLPICLAAVSIRK
ncbi:hypothetical protein NBRC111894_4394 [Sporolactobacillus inulinus]|uniref:PTS EIIA type-4 domain-containing protein n=1 Tax=Sporolactobacillus inulinus TaxID=2078 RepID=A0A4Y1ZIJ0_9BACL|nr:hypothetical protein NBRC111894_4394 [Sporolactobacillus inulinus]